MMSKSNHVTRTLFVDPDTGEKLIQTKIDVKNAPGAVVKNEVSKLLHQNSPLGQMERLRAIANKLPDSYPEKEKALWWLDGGIGADDTSRMRAIAEAKAVLEHAKLRTKGIQKRKSAKSAGIASGKSRNEKTGDIKEWVLLKAADSLSNGANSRDIVGKILNKIDRELADRHGDEILDFPGDTAPKERTIREWTKDIRAKHKTTK